MGTLGLIAKLKLEGVTKQLRFTVVQNKNWFLNFQIVAYYLQVVLLLLNATYLGPIYSNILSQMVDDPTDDQ